MPKNVGVCASDVMSRNVKTAAGKHVEQGVLQ